VQWANAGGWRSPDLVDQACAAGSFLRSAALVLLCACAGCGSDGVVPPPPTPKDSVPPTISVVFPTDSAFDDDGDALLDVRLQLTDSGGLVDPADIRVRSLRGVNGPAGNDANLLDHWRVETRDTARLVFHEVIENLLHGGENRLEIAVPDTAGNVATDTITFLLPHGQLQRTLISGLTSGGIAHGIGVVVCPDDDRVYMAAGRSIVVADALDPKILTTVRYQLAPDNFYVPLCVQDDPILYVTLAVMRFDRTSLQWLSEVTPSYGSIGIVQSRADPNLLYVGESYTGSIGIIDRAQAARVGQVPFPWSSYEFVADLAVLAGDTKLYASRLVEEGILVLNPATGEILARIAIGGPNWPGLGVTDDFVLSHDDRWLYVALLDGDPRGVVLVNTQTDRVVRTLPLPDYVPQAIELSPSGNRLFVTTQDRWVSTPSKNVLIDVPGWRVLEEFPRPRPAGVTRFDGGVAFRRDGKLAFVAHGLDIDIYLIRE
jgi:DNA-binding beta-propeller fold protein YncE